MKNTNMEHEKFIMLEQLYSRLQQHEERYKMVFNIANQSRDYGNYVIIATTKVNKDKRKIDINKEFYDAILIEFMQNLRNKIDIIKQEINEAL